MDKGSASAEQNKRLLRGFSKRKRTTTDEASADNQVGTTAAGGASSSSSNLPESGAEDGHFALLPPRSKRSRHGVTNSSQSVFEKEPGQDHSRTLTDLVDYFPAVQLGRRFTRSLAKQISHPSESTQPSSEGSPQLQQDSAPSSSGRRASASLVSTSKYSATRSARAPSLPANAIEANSSSTSAGKTGCHLSRKTHPSVGGTSSGGNSRSAKVGNNSSEGNSEEARQSDNNNLSVPMEQDQPNSASGGGKRGSRSHSTQIPSTVSKHGVGGGYSVPNTVNTLIDLERDGGSSSSDSMDGSSGIGSSSVAGGLASGAGAGTGGSGRLHTLLDARNLPMHIFGALGPRMQTLFNRCPSSHGGSGGATGSLGGSTGGGGRFDSLIQGMQKGDDPSTQLQSLIELCNILVMSNEETLGPNFPVKDTIRCLIKLLQSEQSYDIMTHACRALTYLMEAAPRVTPAVTDAVPLLLDKLQRVECIDVAEQALAALDLLSRRHSKCILVAGGIGACLQYIDFFSLASQRSALQIVANCCLHMTADDFHFLDDSLPALTQRLNATDKKTVELICVLFTRLVENYSSEPDKLRRLCDYGLLENVQQMIIASPPIVSSSVLVGIIRMMHTLCRQCSELAVRLIRLNVVAALRFLLMGTSDADAVADAELLARTPQELYELVLLISELLPPLPSDGHLFEVDNWLKNWYYYYQSGRCMYTPFTFGSSHPAVGRDSVIMPTEQVFWAWKDEQGLWRPFAHVDNHLLEAAHQAREEEVSLSTPGQQYTVDLVNMVQINEETGFSRPVQRKVTGTHCNTRAATSKTPAVPSIDPRLELSRADPKLYEEMVRCLLPILYDIYTSVGGPAVRHECLRGMLRMIYHSDGELLLREALKKDAVSSLLAGMLNSTDLKTVVPALQLCTVLMEKLPDVFHVCFRREGVTHQLRRLANGEIQFTSTPSGASVSTSVLATADGFLSSGGSSSSSHGFGSGASSNSGLMGVPPTMSHGLLDRASSRDAEGVGLNAISSVDQFLSAMSGLPLLRHYHHNRYVHHRQQAFDSANDLPKPTMPDSGTGHATGAAGGADLLMDSMTPLSSCLPPPLSPTVTAPSSGGGAVPKRHQRHHGSGSSSSGGSQTASSSQIKTRRATAAANSKQTSSGSTRAVGTRNTRSKVNSEVSSTLSAAATSSTNESSSQSTTASGFFQSLPFPKWARGSNATASSANTGTSHRKTSAPSTAKSMVQQHLRQKQLAQQSSASGDNLHGSMMPSMSLPATSVSSANSPSLNAEKCIAWVRQQAKTLMTKYFFDGELVNEGNSGDLVSSAAQHAANVLERLIALASCLKRGDVGAIVQLAEILSSPTNVSCFELLQSGLIAALTEYLAGFKSSDKIGEDRIRAFCKAFFDVQCRADADDDGVSTVRVEYSRDWNAADGEWTHPARLLLSKLHVCVSQLEQFPVKVHDLAGASGAAGGLVNFGGGAASGLAMMGGGGGPLGLIGHLSGMGGGPSSLRGLSALRFLHSQQIKCHLQRHSDEKRLKQWRRGPIKIDPLAQVVTVEKYLLTKGFGRRCNGSSDDVSGDDDESTDDDDDEDDENPALFLSELSDGAHRLQILINDRVLPYDMTIYQAVRQYGLRGNVYNVSGDGANVGGIHGGGGGNYSSEWIGPELWIHTHTLTYRLAPEAANKINPSSTSSQEAGGMTATSSIGGQKPARSKTGSKTEKQSPTSPSGDKSSADLGELKEPVDVLAPYLVSRLPSAAVGPYTDTISASQPLPTTSSAPIQQQSIQDPSLECVNLIRILFGISRNWWSLYKDSIVTNFQPLLPLNEFHNTKLSAKVGRQLQDPLTVVAGQLPHWIEQLTNVCPFLFPFEVRLAVFHVVALDRDRALQRLLDSSGENGGGGGSSERITPRLERRKVMVNRDDLLRQAETVFGSMESSRAVLEVQYENEVGTGLGPTLEFYALVSRQFQRAELQLWRGLTEDTQPTKSTAEKRVGKDNVANAVGGGGLCPLPLGRHVKSNTLDKVLGKFRLLGKLLGRSLLDGRILDLPLSSVFYKWLLKEEHTLSWADLADLDPVLHRSVLYLWRQQLKAVRLGDTSKECEARKAVEVMELDFTVPGFPALELVKNGKDKLVTLDNLQQYLDLLLHWLLKAGVCRQMEAVRDCLNDLIPLKHLRLFFAEEMDQLFCGARSDPESWDPSILLQALRPDHGYNHDSAPIRWLVDILATRFDDERRRQFIQFITGSPRLPVGGLKNLNPPLTVVRKTEWSNIGNPDAHLPSVMTCVNYLKLPEYTSREVMEHRLLTAITHGRYSFHLS